ncbi:hypothetical protein [Actinoalloteichus spitiensis]|uniref:hypothetical protein n=1 Tax=Actinoalloteichus spitiensis TaxID=252394 RepID=UPI00037417D2|nr:hypothetical protein [Actinoalloteichus spitiensis]
MRSEPPPRSVRLAGLLVALQGLGGLGFVAVFLTREVGGVGQETGGSGFGHVAYFSLLSLGVLAIAAGLLRGRPWARTPALFVQILLFAVAWYAFGPSEQRLAGLALGAVCVATFVALCTIRARLWAVNLTEEELARRAGEPLPAGTGPEDGSSGNS